MLNDAPNLPSHLVMTLMGLANHADRDGRGAYPSQRVMAGYARKDERRIRRDLAELSELGLVSRGDQRMVSHLPPHRRPIVYDLAVDKYTPVSVDNLVIDESNGRVQETGGVHKPGHVDPLTNGMGGSTDPGWGGLQTRQTVLRTFLRT